MNHTSLTESNRSIVEGLYAAGTRNDFNDIVSRMDESIVVHEPPFLPYAGSYKGMDSYMQKLVPFLAEYLDLPTLKISYIVADGDRVMACINLREMKTGKQLHLIEAFTLKNKKIVDVRIFYFDAGSLIDSK